jgi:hypothetical protein
MIQLNATKAGVFVMLWFIGGKDRGLMVNAVLKNAAALRQARL